MSLQKRNHFDDHLPPTKNAILPALKCANYQAMVGQKYVRSLQDFPSPIDPGWIQPENNFEPFHPSEPDNLLQILNLLTISRYRN